ncbi:PREDICTED: serine/threonine-protein phosphatase rdgC [Nicrophorus vespilloides]|uniref:Serine/threonine-protein phosphatase with EF-hands n=1 Tax=Nicrophorus vespilloides TaxID=110193 RepID=A0ABM1MLR4_NICVS|nr:PREDICTED: serine/threonine-protein phosphatase rdgC [Nicrophorus vespilloides]
MSGTGATDEQDSRSILDDQRVPTSRRRRFVSCFKIRLKAILMFLLPKKIAAFFEPKRDVVKIESAIKSAILIQRWYRLHRASLELRKRYTWTIFQRIEYSSEHHQIQVYNFYRCLLNNIPIVKQLAETRVENASIDLLNMKMWNDAEAQIRADKKYKGIHVNFPMRKADLHNLIQHFNDRKKPKLHACYVAKILIEAVFHLRKLPNINVLHMNVSQEFTVCGDIHGQLDDLLLILQKNGLPSQENPYIFNGDFVDRGKCGLEVLLILLSCLLVFPEGMYLNRGNHEDLAVNERYGFYAEVELKYRRHNSNLFKLFEELYRWLPLATVIDDRIFVAHGGISDRTELGIIRNANRSRFDSILRPSEMSQEDMSEEDKKIFNDEWTQVRDLLWSDPASTDGCAANKIRGAGTFFGADVTEEFLLQNDFDLLIRSHECKADGFEITHRNKLITIFSASNYYSVGSNRGAYLKIFGSDLKYKVVQFNASRAKRLTFRERIDVVEASAIRELYRHIEINRTKLLVAFNKFDPDNDGVISLKDWCSCMEKTTGLSLPWRLLREKLVTQDERSEMILYNSTFSKYKYSLSNNGEGVMDILYDNKVRLQKIFRIIDKDNAGYICLEKLLDACNAINERLPNAVSTGDLDAFFNLMDTNKDGGIDLNEFLETFRIANAGSSTKGELPEVVGHVDLDQVDIVESPYSDEVEI